MLQFDNPSRLTKNEKKKKPGMISQIIRGEQNELVPYLPTIN